MNHVDAHAPVLRIGSCCTGIWGLDLGVSRALSHLGVESEHVVLCEGEAFAARVCAARMESGEVHRAPIWSDVRTLGSLGIEVDMLVGGFPCQDISTAGKGAGLDGERSGLFFAMLDAAVQMGCGYLFLENVSAIATRGLDRVLGSLAEAGFDAEWCYLRASDVGAPHKRERWFCLAYSQRGAGARLSRGGVEGRRAPEGGGDDLQASAGRYVGQLERGLGDSGASDMAHPDGDDWRG
ncbi:MAG: hypothetical protein DRR06_18650, partial [Gammaproteobacteria bacterium]